MDQLFGVPVAVIAEGDTDASSDVHLGLGNEERLGQGRVDAVRAGVGLGCGLEIFEQNQKLIARLTGQSVPGSKHRGQPLRQCHEHLVAGPVPVGVVDRLEPVQVDEQHGKGLSGALLSLPGVLDPFQHEHAVGKPRQGIVESRLGRAVRALLQVGARLSVEELSGSDVGEGLGRAPSSLRTRGRGRLDTGPERPAGARHG